VSNPHDTLREKVNKELSKPLLGGLTASGSSTIRSGLSSGSYLLNVRMSGNPFIGYVWGRIAELYGPEGGGKTTMALHAIYEAQKLEAESGESIPCVYIDAEQTLDPLYAESLGIDLNNLSISQVSVCEDVFELIESLIRNGCKVIVIDSVAALVPSAEIEGDMGDAHMGLKARLMGQGLRKVTELAAKNNVITIFINQIRMKIGVMFGNPETTTGGKALKFYATYRLDIRSPRSGAKTSKGKSLEEYGCDGSVETGTITNIHVVKNKVFPPHRKASVQIDYGLGINKIEDVINFLKVSNIPDSEGLVNIASKKKKYTLNGLKRVLDDSEVQSYVLDLIKKDCKDGDK
jgi:recombination protein RecA